MVLKFPCKICLKAVANSHHAIQCDNCNIWVHIKCNKINTNINFYKKAQQSGTVLNALRKYVRFQTSQLKNFLKLIKEKT